MGDPKFKFYELPDGRIVQCIALVDEDGNIVTPGAGGASWQKVTINYTDFQPDAAAFNFINCFQVPADNQVSRIIIIPRVPFAGGTITAAVFGIYESTQNYPFSNINSIDVFAAISNVRGRISDCEITDNNGLMDKTGSYTQCYISLTGGVINDLTAGQIDVYYLLDDLTGL